MKKSLHCLTVGITDARPAFLRTWSALKSYQEKNHDDPLEQIRIYLQQHTDPIELSFPIYLRVGRL